ncbi:MAG TPA: chorismate-binding protein, partial [Polyangiaceae bacterium]
MTMFAEQSKISDNGLLHELRRAVDALEPAGRAYAVARIAVPSRRAELLLRLDPALDASYWAVPGGYEHVALGSLATLSSAGAERFESTGDQARRLFEQFPGGTSPRLFGGFAFQAGRARSDAWRPFGEGRFVLPRLSYERKGEDAELQLVLPAAELANPESRARAVHSAERLLISLQEDVEEPPSEPGPVTLDERPDAEFVALIGRIRAAIEQGELEKLVLARRVGLTLPRPIDSARVLRRLSAIAPECVRFAFRTEGTTFLGATPERLVDKCGTTFETDALAGSIRMGEAPLRLMESQKE